MLNYCTRLLRPALPLLLLLPLAGCGGEPDLVVYAALDAEFSKPILESFEEESGLEVAPKFDTEAAKTVGLTNAIIAEADRPRCDLFWNNEILNTLRLQRKGLLDVYVSPLAENYPAMYRSADGLWHGFAARARVLIVNTELLPDENERPTSVLDLADPMWKGRCAIAKPLFGTTASHAACLFAHWGDERAKEYFLSLKANDVQILPGNKQVATNVAAGRLAFGLTDTDDAIIAKEQGHPVEIIYPDGGEEQMGTLFIPNTLAVIKGCPHPEAAKKLVDYLLTAEVEARLAEGRSAQIPLGRDVKADVRVQTPATVKAMQVDFEQAADKWDVAAEFLRETFAVD